MKRQWQHPEVEDAPQTGRRYWRSIGEVNDTPQFRQWLETEFPRGAAELGGPEADDVSRRGFLRLMGAASALAGFGMTGCSRPDAFLVPYAKNVEWMIPGKPLLFATAMPRGNGAVPMVVTTHEGRPTKVDGNPLHPDSNGGSDALAQASILDLYDPDRSKEFLREGEVVDAVEFDNFVKEWQLLANIDGGKGTAVLVGESTSPARAAQLEKLQAKYPKLQVYRYEAVSGEQVRRGTRIAFGAGVTQLPRFDRADRVLSLGCDFLGVDSLGGESVQQFSKRRSLKGDKRSMNRLYVVESAFSITGGMADHRYRMAASQLNKVAVLFVSAIAEASGQASLGAAVEPLLGKANTAVFDMEWIETCAADLVAAKGKALVVASPRMPAEMHVLVARINEALGAIAGADAPIQLLRTDEKNFPGLGGLAGVISKGEITTLVVTTDADPVYDAPPSLKIAEKFTSVETTLHLGTRLNATARAAAWHVPGAHYLETWGDALSATGTYSVIQPMIHALNGGVSELELLLKLTAVAPEPAAEGKEAETAGTAETPTTNDAGPVYAAVKESFAAQLKGSGDLEKVWNHTLRDGFLLKSQFASIAGAKVNAVKANAAIAKMPLFDLPWSESFEVVFPTDSRVLDGRYANNGWLQEVPDPITKLTWDNAALMSGATAEALGVEKDGQMISIEMGGKILEVPALVVPGHADYSLSISLGYGQEGVGRVGNGVGFNVYPIRNAGWGELFRSGAKVRAQPSVHELALTAEHYSMEGRALVREGTLDRLNDDPGFAKSEGMDAHIPENISLYKGPDYFAADSPQNDNFPVDPHHQWGMTIDLNSCIGCNACVVACQSENNIPIVGKGQVIAGREMHWIRMDRYFSSPKEEDGEERGRRVINDDAIEMLNQPVACVQCESAPCETVCPVNATVHSDDGLNVMAYNRCIGTRYCANNCPYKARRFNFFDYNARPLDKLYQGPIAPLEGNAKTSLSLQKNPNVTVRMRGVIEKCTYCVQRIQTAKIAAKKKAGPSKDVKVPTNTVKVACQQACPAEAIVFGNMKDPQDRVLKTKADTRNYDLLKYIGTLPRTSYLARVRNPNEKMPDAAHVGHATEHMH